MLERLLSQLQWLIQHHKAEVIDAEEWLEQARPFLSQIDAGLVSDDESAVRWQLTRDGVTHLVQLYDELYGKLRSMSFKSGQSTSPAPPELFMNKLHYVRNQLFPPPVLGPWIDLSRLRRWLDHCDAHHTAHCLLSPSSKEIFGHRPRRLIDLERMCLVPCEQGQRYMALSYVWGAAPAFTTRKRTIGRLLQDGSLLNSSLAESPGSRDASTQTADETLVIHLPQTIRDAMELARRLGEQYLWVDSLCIVQDDDDEKREELAHMGSIYANAYVTVVAAGGTTAFSGLRGIENATPPMARAAAQKGTVPEYLLHGRAYAITRNIEALQRRLRASTWNSRAWTFQEQIFSRRLLVLDGTSVAWECHCAVWLEGMDTPQQPATCQNNAAVAAQGLSFSAQPCFDDYARHVVQYNGRNLSFPEDALDAFAGILATLSRTAFSRGGFLCGLPVLFFDAALLWYNSSPLERRRAARQPRRRQQGDDDVGDAATSSSSPVLPPSWAWAAWGGTVDYSHFGSSKKDSRGHEMGIQPLVQWQYRENGEQRWRFVSSVWNDEKQIVGAYDTEAGDGADVGLIPAVPAGSDLLLSYPLRGFFPILEPCGAVQLLLADGADGCAGMLASCEALPIDELGAGGPRPLCEVVAISESCVNDQDTYNVLWIDWEDGIAYRKGTGRILKSAWEARETERIQLVLG
ncbi:heterokaryon incompatibility [Corynascus similis CBS 632.67]